MKAKYERQVEEERRARELVEKELHAGVPAAPAGPPMV